MSTVTESVKIKLKKVQDKTLESGADTVIRLQKPWVSNVLIVDFESNFDENATLRKKRANFFNKNGCIRW